MYNVQTALGDFGIISKSHECCLSCILILTALAGILLKFLRWFALPQSVVTLRQSKTALLTVHVTPTLGKPRWLIADARISSICMPLSHHREPFPLSPVCLSVQQCSPSVVRSCHHYHYSRDKRFVTTKHVFCRDKNMLVATNLCHSIFLSWKNVFCHDKHVFVTTKVCLSRQNFCCDKITVSVMTNICRDKSFVATEILCCDKHNFIITKHVFCPNKSMLVATKDVVETNTCLSWQTHVCRGKIFVVTKIILVAAPAIDTPSRSLHPGAGACPLLLPPCRRCRRAGGGGGGGFSRLALCVSEGTPATSCR